MAQVGGGPLVRCLLNSGQAVVLGAEAVSAGQTFFRKAGWIQGKKPT